MPEDVRDQAKNALAIVEKALAEGGFQLADVVRATYYITDMVYWDAIGPVLGKIFGDIRPAATCLVCALVKPEMKFEVEVTALRRSEEHTSELQSLMRISYAVFCLKKKKKTHNRAKQDDET